MERFVCRVGKETAQLSREQIDALGLTQPEQLHMDPSALSTAAAAGEKGGWVRVPFCNTLCAEGLGARPELTLGGAKLRETPFQRPEELPETFSAEFPRMKTMLAALELLEKQGKAVIYQIEGPFTLLSYLLPMGRMFSALRKPQGQEMLIKAENWVMEYAGAVAEYGVKILSFADPVAAIDILGEKVFNGIYCACCRKILQRLIAEYPNIKIHLCGRLTQSLIDVGVCTAEPWFPQAECETYAQALSAWCGRENETAAAGQYCLNLLETKHPFVNRILFNSQGE